MGGWLEPGEDGQKANVKQEPKTAGMLQISFEV